MNISGYIKQSLMDYPGQIASVVFTQGCNFRCPYCHNQALLPCSAGAEDADAVMRHIVRNRMLLDGVVITGGEPMLQADLADFLSEIKQLGLLVKLDTNGSDPGQLARLLKRNLIDYVAMDIKSALTIDAYSNATGVSFNGATIGRIRESITIIKGASVKAEFRTTVCEELISVEDIGQILAVVGDKHAYFLQQFVGDGVMRFSPFSARQVAAVDALIVNSDNVNWR